MTDVPNTLGRGTDSVTPATACICLTTWDFQNWKDTKERSTVFSDCEVENGVTNSGETLAVGCYRPSKIVFARFSVRIYPQTVTAVPVTTRVNKTFNDKN